MIIYLTNWWNIFVESFIQLWQGTSKILIPLIGAALVILIGWFLAFSLGHIVKRILGQKNIPWNRILSNIGLTPILEDRLGLSTDIGAFLGWLVKWFLIITTFIAAMSILQLQGVNTFMGTVVAFVPTTVTAALIVLIGAFVGVFADKVLTRIIGAINIEANVAGIVARWVIFAFSILAAARYLNLQLDTLWPKFIDFLVFAGAIAVGFGFSARAREWFEKIKG